MAVIPFSNPLEIHQKSPREATDRKTAASPVVSGKRRSAFSLVSLSSSTGGPPCQTMQKSEPPVFRTKERNPFTDVSEHQSL